MRRLTNIPFDRFKSYMDVIKIILLVILFIMFMSFNIRIGREVSTTGQISTQTNKILESDNQIIKDIQNQTNDNHQTSQQELNTIICMLQVPIESRTTDLEQACQKAADSTPSTSSPVLSSQNPNTQIKQTPTQASTTPTTSQSAASQGSSTGQGVQGSTGQTDQPLKVLGLKVCVPLTNVCVDTH